MEDPALVDESVQLGMPQLELFVEESKKRVAFMYAPVQPAGWLVFRGYSSRRGARVGRHRVTFENGSG